VIVVLNLILAEIAQRLALPARAGIGGKSYQTPNPPLGPESRKCGQRPHFDVVKVFRQQRGQI